MARILPVILGLAAVSLVLVTAVSSGEARPPRREWVPPNNVAPPVPPSSAPAARQNAATQPRWGALANSGNHFFFTVGKSSEVQARSEAIELCRKQYSDKCQFQTVVYDSCISIATVKGKSFGWAADKDWKKAVIGALGSCSSELCKSYLTFCSHNGKIDQDKVASVTDRIHVAGSSSGKEGGSARAQESSPPKEASEGKIIMAKDAMLDNSKDGPGWWGAAVFLKRSGRSDGLASAMFSYNEKSEELAVKSAKAKCEQERRGGDSCSLVSSFKDKCFAVAYHLDQVRVKNKNGEYVFVYSSPYWSVGNKDTVKESALRACGNEEGKKCKVQEPHFSCARVISTPSALESIGNLIGAANKAICGDVECKANPPTGREAECRSRQYSCEASCTGLSEKFLNNLKSDCMSKCYGAYDMCMRQ